MDNAEEYFTDSTTEIGRAAEGFSPLEWSDQKVSDLWSFYASTEASNYFAARFGKALLRRVKSHLPQSGKVADYGCGRGQISGLLAQHYPVLAADFQETLKVVQPTLEAQNTPNPITFASLDNPDSLNAHEGTADALLFIEAIEHLLDPWIDPTFNAINDLLKPNGIIICSTPNDEKVQSAMVCCPSCKTYFHKYQHMRTFTPDSLKSFMEERGFETIDVKTYNLGMESPYARTKQALKRMLGRGNLPHLVYVGRKR